MMTLAEYIEEVIKRGIEAAKKDYANEEKKHHLLGSIRGFEECRGKETWEVKDLLYSARMQTSKAFRERAEDYWYWRCCELEIEWVANCISAVLLNEGRYRHIIIEPTYRACKLAAEILGVEDNI